MQIQLQHVIFSNKIIIDIIEIFGQIFTFVEEIVHFFVGDNVKASLI